MATKKKTIRKSAKTKADAKVTGLSAKDLRAASGGVKTPSMPLNGHYIADPSTHALGGVSPSPRTAVQDSLAGQQWTVNKTTGNNGIKQANADKAWSKTKDVVQMGTSIVGAVTGAVKA